MRLEVSTAIGGTRRAPGTQLRDGHAGLGEHLEQECLELVVGAVDLVDQQYRRPRPGVLDRGEQRPGQQVLGG